MLQVLLHCGIGEICVVVTRWFGGVKLGTGGLVRAYQDSVRENLSTLALAEQVPLAHLDLTLEYAHLDGLRRLLPTFEARITDEDYQATAGLGEPAGGAPGGFPQSRGRNEQRRGRLPG